MSVAELHRKMHWPSESSESVLLTSHADTLVLFMSDNGAEGAYDGESHLNHNSATRQMTSCQKPNHSSTVVLSTSSSTSTMIIVSPTWAITTRSSGMGHAGPKLPLPPQDYIKCIQPRGVFGFLALRGIQSSLTSRDKLSKRLRT